MRQLMSLSADANPNKTCLFNGYLLYKLKTMLNGINCINVSVFLIFSKAFFYLISLKYFLPFIENAQ